MKKIHIIVLLLIISMAISSCNANQNYAVNSNDNPTTAQVTGTVSQSNKISSQSQQFGDIKDILIKSGELPNDLAVVGVKDEKQLYCFVGPTWKNIYLYNIETGERKLFREPVSPKKFIKTAAVNENWLVWNEDEDEIETDFTNCKNWATYAQNLKTGEIIEIDKYKKFDLEPGTAFNALAPRKISLYGDKIVYNNFDLLEDKKAYAVIKLYDLSERKMSIIDRIKDYKMGFYSYPVIYGNHVVWSYSRCNMETYAENGDSFLYDINTKQKTKISTSDEILWPHIYKNYVAARVKPEGQNENSRIALYDLDGNKKWEDIVSPDIDIYKNKTHVETCFPTVSSNYLYWADNIEKVFAIYSIQDNKFYKLCEAKEANHSTKADYIYGKMVFWCEITYNQKDLLKNEVVNKYAILK